MSRQVIITCDLCQQVVPAAAESWRGLDVCGTCLAGSRPVAEVLTLVRGVVDGDGTFVSVNDIIPERTRRRALPRNG